MRVHILIAIFLLPLIIFSSISATAQLPKQEDIDRFIELIKNTGSFNQIKKGKKDDDDRDNDDERDDDDNHYDDDDDNGYYDDDDNNDNDIPLDGGLSFLAIAGAGLGIKKMRDHRSKKKQDTNNQP